MNGIEERAQNQIWTNMVNWSLDNGAKSINGEKIFLSTNCAGTIGFPCAGKNMNLNTTLTSLHTSHKSTQNPSDLNIKTQNNILRR